MNDGAIEAFAIEGIPEVDPGADLAALIVAALAPDRLDDGDIVVVAQKIVSKAEGRTRDLTQIEPDDEARALAAECDKDARLVQAILDESASVVRAAPGVLITRTRHGFVCANAGIDRSNVPGSDTLLLLPADPDRSARELRAALAPGRAPAIGVIVTDSFGRAWRVGQQDVAIGVAGLTPVVDLRGRRDREGRELTASIEAVADALAAAADLCRGKHHGHPVVVIRGRADLLIEDDGPGAAAIRRAADRDLFG